VLRVLILSSRCTTTKTTPEFSGPTAAHSPPPFQNRFTATSERAQPGVRSSASSATRATTASIVPFVPAIYLPYTTLMRPYAQFFIRTQGDPLTYLQSIRAALASVDSDQQISTSGYNRTFTLNEAIQRDAQYSRQRLFSILFGIFSAMALALALVGIFSVVAYSVAQHATEFGVRLALARRARMCCGLPRASPSSARWRAWSSVSPLTPFSVPPSPTGCKAPLPRAVCSQPPRFSRSARYSPASCPHATPSPSHPPKRSAMNARARVGIGKRT
jgi:hypothetical protein